MPVKILIDRYDVTPSDYISMIITDYGMVNNVLALSFSFHLLLEAHDGFTFLKFDLGGAIPEWIGVHTKRGDRK